jgi:hypothetical protein
MSGLFEIALIGFGVFALLFAGLMIHLVVDFVRWSRFDDGP